MLISQDLTRFGKMDFWEALLKVEMLIFVMFISILMVMERTQNVADTLQKKSFQ